MNSRTLTLLAFACALPSMTSGGGFGKLPVSARAVTLGGSLVAIQKDPNVLFTNPAGIASMSSIDVSTSYVSLFDGIVDDKLRYISGSAAVNFSSLGTFGLGLVSFQSNSWKEGMLVGSYGAELLGMVSVGGSVKALYWSASAPQGRLALPEPKALSKTVLSFDVGVQAKVTDILPENDLIVGLSVQDISRPSIAIDNSDDAALDRVQTFGVTYQSRALEYLVSIQYSKAGSVERYGVGVEILATRGTIAGQDIGLTVRAGTSTVSVPNIQGDIFGGFGLGVSGFLLDYAYGQPRAIQGLAGIHHMTLRYTF